MLTAWDGLEQAHTVALGVEERHILPYSRYLDRFTKHSAARISDFPRRFFDVVHSDNDRGVLRGPIRLFLEKNHH